VHGKEGVKVDQRRGHKVKGQGHTYVLDKKKMFRL